MDPINHAIVIDQNGERGMVDSVEAEDSALDRITIRLSTRQSLDVPRNLLVRREHGVYSIPATFEQLLTTGTRDLSVETERAETREDQRVIPVISEDVKIGKREVETGRVRVSKTVHEEERLIDELLMRDEVSVERRTINQYVDAPVPVRYEGDTMIVPLLEEVLVVEKRLLLREELHITKRQVEERHADSVRLRREEAHVERFPKEDESSQ
jgi:uncharacterized protein (TIGR02271 family)